MKIPAFLAGLFENYVIETMNTEKHAGMIIKAVLARGTWEQVQWMFDYFGVEKIRETFLGDYYGLHTLPESTRRLWGLVFAGELLPEEKGIVKWCCRRRVPASNQRSGCEE